MFRNLRRQSTSWQAPGQARYHQRERLFFQGASLTLAGGMAFLPSWLFLVHAPRFQHARVVAALVLPLVVFAAGAGLKKLISCMAEQPLDHLTAFAFGVLLIFGVSLIYTCFFFYLAR